MTTTERTVGSGLTGELAAARLAEVGPNTIPEPARPGVAARVLVQLRDPMIMLLLAAAALAVWLGDLSDAAVIVVVVVLNTGVGVLQELRAERALSALRALSAPTARLLRDGRREERPAAEVVPGDVVFVEGGDIVPADGRLLEAHQLQVDEAALTGESVPVDKELTAGSGEPGTLSAGTVLTRGRAVLLVTHTGPASGLGRIATLLGEQRPRPTPLQHRLSSLGWVLAVAALTLSAAVVASGLLRGRPVAEMVLTGVSLAVAAVPESLPAVVTLALALGAHRMARRAAVVRRLPAVETLGSVTVVAADKTGTLTEGRMLVERAWTPDGGLTEFGGSGYLPVGEVRPGPAQGLLDLLRDAVLCSDAELQAPDAEHPQWRPVGDPTEAALVVAAAKAGLSAAALRTSHPRCAELPFDSASRRMVTVHRRPGGPGWLVVCKGAPEVLLNDPELVLPDEHRERALATAAELAAAGHRVLAVAAAERDQSTPQPPPPTDPRLRLRLIGLLGISDPPRPDAARVVTAFHEAGVQLLMITGDHPHTARAIADRVGIGVRTTDDTTDDIAAVVTGAELATGLSDERAASARVYARTHPEQKLDIVADWQRRGHVVAMTGDGVNDAPALRRADIGVAMGGGSDVAREAADLVLTNDSLATMIAAIEEGRRIYTNVRTFLRYALAGGVAEVLVMLLGPLLGLAVPLLPAQLLWINMLTHGLPGVALGAEPADPAAMRVAPRSPKEFVLGGGLWRRIAWTGALIALVSLAVGGWSYRGGGAWQSSTFLTLGLAQLGVAIALRRRDRRQPGRRRPRFLDVAVAGAALLQLSGVFLPPVAALLGTRPISLTELAVSVCAALLPGCVVFASIRYSRRSGTVQRT